MNARFVKQRADEERERRKKERREVGAVHTAARLPEDGSEEIGDTGGNGRCNEDDETVTMAWCGRVSGSCRLQVVCLLGNQPLRTVPTEGLSPTRDPDSSPSPHPADGSLTI